MSLAHSPKNSSGSFKFEVEQDDMNATIASQMQVTLPSIKKMKNKKFVKAH